MENIINNHNIDKILSEINNRNDFLELIEYIFYYDMELLIKDISIKESELKDDINKLKLLEKISIYIYSNYTNELFNKNQDLRDKALELVALTFERASIYFKHMDLNIIDGRDIVLKRLKYCFRSSIAYSLAGNSPNSIFMANKIIKLFKYIDKHEGYYDKDLITLYRFSSYILNRKFSLSTSKLSKKQSSILFSLTRYINTGNQDHYFMAINDLQSLISSKLEKCQSEQFWILRNIYLVLQKFYDNCVWTVLYNIFDNNYIKQLIKSRPPILELWPNQLKIVNNPNSFLNVDFKNRILINLPTSGGKSLLAEFALIKELEKNNNKKCIYIVPTNALVYEVYKRLQERFRRLEYNVLNIPGGYEDHGEKLFQEYSVLITTPEKMDTIIRNNIRNNFLDDVSLVIFDEFHKISDKNRGWVIESSLWYLINSDSYKDIKIMLLSAIIDNGEVILDWVKETEDLNENICDNWKPTLQIKGIAKYEYIKNKYGQWVSVPKKHKYYKEAYKCHIATGFLKYFQKDLEKRTIKLFDFPRYHYKSSNKLVKKENINYESFVMGISQKLENTGGNLIFFNTKGDVESFVRSYEPYVPEKVKISQEINRLINYFEKRLGKEHLLIKGLKKGIAYHHGSLPIDMREALEDYYSKGYIKTLAATTTLAEGVNFPIQNFIYSGLKYVGQKTIDIADFKNIAGRAGRAYQSTYGQIIFVKFYPYSVKEDYLEYENYDNNVTSSLLSDEKIFEIIDEMNKKNSEDIEDFIDQASNNGFIKTLLLFYNSISENENLLDRIFSNALFSKQLQQDKLKNLLHSSKKVYHYFDKKPLRIREKVQISGLSFYSYYIVQKLAKDIVDNLDYNIRNNLKMEMLIKQEAFIQILSLKEFNKMKVRRSTPASKKIVIDDYSLFLDWTQTNINVPQLSEKYFFKVKQPYRISRITEYIKEMYEYKLSWALSILSRIINENLSLDISSNIINFINKLSQFVKYGLYSTTALDLVKLGFNSRDTINELAEFIDNNYEYFKLKELGNIISTLDHNILSDKLDSITDYELRKFITITNNLKIISKQIEKDKKVKTKIAGTKYHLCRLEEKQNILDKIKKNSKRIVLIPEPDNYYDKYAVEVYYNQTKIGYLSRNINEEVAYYLSIYTPYTIDLININVVNLNKYIEIKVKINFEV
ncbi:DEAD/DEAH box helicase [Iocasia frigidifontis]|uniref:DEAD/DEAH box helicase n=1 Tax=Iocasia fonsfrigidae TaxID=2682810 RepID=A0A8A7KEZ9_9FIRM|nr:DEAD/DEAH box helicase [Iocasia fonsfrigidae]QTL97477.1 DEAD/DEAH box helicase [Iocasia fonsfrigidae]